MRIPTPTPPPVPAEKETVYVTLPVVTATVDKPIPGWTVTEQMPGTPYPVPTDVLVTVPGSPGPTVKEYVPGPTVNAAPLPAITVKEPYEVKVTETVTGSPPPDPGSATSRPDPLPMPSVLQAVFPSAPGYLDHVAVPTVTETTTEPGTPIAAETATATATVTHTEYVTNVVHAKFPDLGFMVPVITLAAVFAAIAAGLSIKRRLDERTRSASAE